MTQRDIYFFEGELLRVTEDEKRIYFDLYKNGQETNPYFSFELYLDEQNNYTFVFNNSNKNNIPEEAKTILNLGRVRRCLTEYYHFIDAFDFLEECASQ